MWQMVFAYVLVKGWIIDPDKHWFFNRSGEVLLLPSHYTKIVDVGIVTSDVAMVIDRGGGLLVFLQPLSKCSSCLTNIFFITLQPITFEPVYYATFVGNVVFIFWSHQFIFQGLATSEMNFYAIFLSNVLYCFTQAFFIWNSYVTFVFGLDVFLFCLFLVHLASTSFFWLPILCIACCQSLVYVCMFFFKQLLIGTDVLCPM